MAGFNVGMVERQTPELPLSFRRGHETLELHHDTIPVTETGRPVGHGGILIILGSEDISGEGLILELT